ncbi:MAG: hypothetical protein CMP63_04540 [Flavobacteriales bacterium]|nr:hypothetical protein [Flavobacteriales bacterium]|tara:strand:- start:1976 stop:3154 length:1179 start_codon:yes stop_codon:yes gene_type:complete
MNKFLLLFLFYFNFCFSNTHQFSNVDSLIEKKQFLNAWKLLSSKENEINKEQINLKKIDMCLKYFTKSVSHQAFAFTNLKPGETIIQHRKRAETNLIPTFPFKIDRILDSLIKENPENYNLQKSKGDYYYDIFILFGRDWIISQQEVLRRMYTAYSTADKNGINDYLSLYALGYFHHLNSESDKATQYFKRSLILDSNHAPTHYNLAYIYTEMDSNELALKHAWKAYSKYKYINYKNDAGQMTGSILGKLGRHEEAISILLDCDRLIPGTYHTYYYLLNSFLHLKKTQEALITAENMFALDWKSHTINTDIIEFFIKTNHSDELISFYKEKLNKEKYDMEFRGHIQLHIAQAYSLVNDEIQTLKYVNYARESFLICYDNNHPVFRVLEKMSE